MTSQTSSPTFSHSRTIPGRLHTENDNPTLSPKRSFPQHELEEDPSQLDLKRRHVRPHVQSYKRVPLDPLSASDLVNRRPRRSHSADSESHYSLVAPPFVPDLRALYPEQPASSGYGATRPSGASTAPVCSWPPPSPGKLSHSNSVGHHASHCGLVHSSDVETTSRATYPSNSFQTESTIIMAKPVRRTGWKSENALQSVRPRTSSMPSSARPPAQHWRSDAPMQAADEPVDVVHSSNPPGLPARELRRRGSDSNLLPHGSMSLSLALGSQPLSASEHTKAVSPIGAERSRVVSLSMTSPRSHGQSSPPRPTRRSSHPSVSPWCPSSTLPNLDAQWKNKKQLLDNACIVENVHVVPGNVNITKEDLERLLRHAIQNKHAPKVASPLSPLRTSASAVDLVSDPDYLLRMPSQLNRPSPRYSKCPPRRARTVCDMYQSFDFDATCIHCQECKRDSVGKKLLAFRYRQQQACHAQRSKFFPLRIATNAGASAVGVDDRMVVASRIREAFAYEIDDEEKSLWEEVAAATGAGSVSFSRIGAPCSAAAHRRGMDDGIEDAAYDDNLETPDDRLLGAESATLFRDISVY